MTTLYKGIAKKRVKKVVELKNDDLSNASLDKLMLEMTDRGLSF